MQVISFGRAAWLALAVSVITLAGCGNSENPNAENQASEKAEADAHGVESRLTLSPEEITTAGIQVLALTPQSFSARIVLTATIRANQDRIAHVAPRVAARLQGVKANLGDRVRQGQVLATLDSIELGEAHSAFEQAKSEFEVAKTDFDRATNLKADNIIPEKDFLRVRSEYQKAKAALQAAEDKLRLLGVSAGEAGAGSVFPIKAPFAGTVIEKDAVLGELAQPDKSLFTVADLSTLWIEANLFEKDLGRVELGAPAAVTVNAYPGETFKGRLTYISSTLDKDTRTVMARIEVPNPKGRLKPEMFATAAIDTPSKLQAMTLPEESVLLINGQPTVFVEEKGGYEPRVVETGEKLDGRLIIKSGIRSGERAVVAGAYALKARLLKSQIGDAD